MTYQPPKRITRRDKQRYVRVRYDGASFVAEPSVALDAIASDDETDYTLEDVWMTPDEFNRLPEFQGF